MALKPCPFCGSVPTIGRIEGSYGYYPPRVAISCCIVSTSAATESWEEGKGHYSCLDEALEKIITKWNTRV